MTHDWLFKVNVGYFLLKPAIHGLKYGRFNKNRLNFNPSMGRLVVLKSIHQSTSVQPACWVVVTRLMLAAVIVVFRCWGGLPCSLPAEHTTVALWETFQHHCIMYGRPNIHVVEWIASASSKSSPLTAWSLHSLTMFARVTSTMVHTIQWCIFVQPCFSGQVC